MAIRTLADPVARSEALEIHWRDKSLKLILSCPSRGRGGCYETDPRIVGAVDVLDVKNG